ncbi:MAG: hypothetical protein OXT63_07525 [Gemmatimonadota bacterium]|nr:hypothetical protein [Gemmatimonadota bacterium]
MVIMDLAGLRSALSEGPLSPEALDAELDRHLRVSRNSNFSLLRGMHLECAADEGGKLTESAVLSGKMTCETVKPSTRSFRFRVNRLRLEG